MRLRGGPETIHFMHDSSRPSQPVGRRLVDFLLGRDTNSRLLHAAFILFVTCSVFQSIWHVPWRDEAQAWLLARDLNLGGLFIEARHDGHPILWHLCLKALQAVGINYVGMQLLNAAFICASVGLLFYHSRLPLLARFAYGFCPACLLSFCYIARNYAIAVFLIFLAATVYRSAKHRPILFATLLALIANTNLYGTAVAIGAGFQFLLEQCYDSNSKGFSLRPIYERYLLPTVILAFAILLVVLQLAPFPQAFEPPLAEPAFLNAATAAPSPPSQHATAFEVRPHLWYFLVAFTALLLLRKRSGAPRLYGAAVVFVLALLPMYSWPPGTRHLFVLTAGAIYFLWIYYDDLELPWNIVQRPATPLKFAAGVTTLVVLLCWSSQRENLQSTFGDHWDGKAAAQAITDHHLDTPDTILVVTDPTRASSVLIHLDHVRADYRPPPWPASPASFSDNFYYRARKHLPTVKELEPFVSAVAAAHPGKTIVVMSSDPHDETATGSDPAYPLKPIYRSPVDPSYHDDPEAYQIYVLDRH